MLDVCRQVSGEGVGVCGGDVHVVGAGGRVEGVEWMHGLHLSCVGIHAAGRLAGLDVAPYHGCHVAFVIHESGIEVRGVVGVWRGDVGGAAGEGVFQEVEHGEELSGGHEHVVTEPASDDLVRLLDRVDGSGWSGGLTE